MASREYWMTVTLDSVNDGLNLTMWMSTVDFFREERLSYPHEYFYNDGRCIWHLHANIELTIKARAMIIEHASAICERDRAINEKRRAANR